jgi:hypothetical protein
MCTTAYRFPPHGYQAVLLLALLSCGRVRSETPDASAAAVWEPGPTPDGECDLSKPFGAASRVPLSRPVTDAWLSDDELRIYATSAYARTRAVYFASRPARDEAFGELKYLDTVPVGAVGPSHPTLARDELTMYLSVYRGELAVARRATLGEPFVFVSQTKFAESVETPYYVDEDGLYYHNTIGTGDRFFQRRWADTDWTGGVIVGGGGVRPIVSRDHRTLYFFGNGDRVNVAYRDNARMRFRRSSVVQEIGETVYPSWLSPNGCRLYATTGELRSIRADVSELVVFHRNR